MGGKEEEIERGSKEGREGRVERMEGGTGELDGGR